MSIVKILISLFRDAFRSREILRSFILQDLRQQYLGSFLGIVWAFVQPLMMLLIMWFVFEVGFRVSPVEDYPFILWLGCGMVPWFFYADAVSNGTNAISAYSFLVKKIVFRVSLLPLVKVFSALCVHLVFLSILFLMFFIYGFKPTIYWLQLPYYTMCLIMLICCFVVLTATLNIFIRDTSHIVSIFLQIMFWGTPIFWGISMIPETYHWIFELNPVFYIVDGYRDALLYQQWFWEKSTQTNLFWSFVLIMTLISIFVFRKLRPYFADVL